VAVAVVSESMARKYWKDVNPLGGRFAFGTRDNPQWITVVGVVKDIKQRRSRNERHPTRMCR
jgi:hypothetical protein